jgi:hypothetical protein
MPLFPALPSFFALVVHSTPQLSISAVGFRGRASERTCPDFQCPFFQGLSLSVCLASRRLIDSIKHTVKLNWLVPKYEFRKKSSWSTDTTPTLAKNFPQLSPTSIGFMMTPEAIIAIVAIFMSVLLSAIAF